MYVSSDGHQEGISGVMSRGWGMSRRDGYVQGMGVCEEGIPWDLVYLPASTDT